MTITTALLPGARPDQFLGSREPRLDTRSRSYATHGDNSPIESMLPRRRDPMCVIPLLLPPGV